MKAIEYYRNLKQETERYTILYQLFCFASIDAFVDNPTEEEYEIFKAQGFDEYWANLMANTFMKIQTLMVENFDFDEDAMSVYGEVGEKGGNK